MTIEQLQFNKFLVEFLKLRKGTYKEGLKEAKRAFKKIYRM